MVSLSSFIWILYAVAWSLHCGIGAAVEILDVRVPAVIENGSIDSVVLDCDYNVEEYEKIGLVVKWYFNDNHSQVYQWIPMQKPQDLGVLKGKINLDYVASNDEYKKHRAMQLLKPTTELTGEYMCRIATFESEEVRSKKMIVYAPAQNVDIMYSKPSPKSVNVSCSAYGVYPEPKLQLFWGQHDRRRKEITGTAIETAWHNGVFDIHRHKLLDDDLLPRETLFECLLWINDTNYQAKRSLMYYPGVSLSTNGGFKGAVSRGGIVVLLAVTILYFNQNS